MSRWLIGPCVVLMVGVALGAAEKRVASHAEKAKPARVYGVFAKLQLTEEQREMIHAIHVEIRQKIDQLEAEEHARSLAVLTDEQKQQVKQIEEEQLKRRREYAHQYYLRHKKQQKQAAATQPDDKAAQSD